MKNSVNKILVAAVVILLLANIAMVIMMMRNKNKEEPKRQGNRTSPIEIMAKEVGMSDQQQKDYQQMRDDHMKNIRPLFDSLRAAKTAFFSLAKSPAQNDSILVKSHKKIEDIEMAVDKSMLEHFRSVRAIFDTAQQRKFDDFVQKMMQRGPGGGHRKDSTSKDK
jgi:hypothetical protein